MNSMASGICFAFGYVFIEKGRVKLYWMCVCVCMLCMQNGFKIRVQLLVSQFIGIVGGIGIKF